MDWALTVRSGSKTKEFFLNSIRQEEERPTQGMVLQAGNLCGSSAYKACTGKSVTPSFLPVSLPTYSVLIGLPHPMHLYHSIPPDSPRPLLTHKHYQAVQIVFTEDGQTHRVGGSPSSQVGLGGGIFLGNSRGNTERERILNLVEKKSKGLSQGRGALALCSVGEPRLKQKLQVPGQKWARLGACPERNQVGERVSTAQALEVLRTWIHLSFTTS